MAPLDHIILFTILFSVFFFVTFLKQKKLDNNYWGLLLIPIVLYSLILGCRYGWGPDYQLYKIRFINPSYYEEVESLGFKFLNTTLNFIGFGYVGGFIVYSLIFILTASIFIKSYSGNKYMILLFLVATLKFSTTCIRQAVAQSIVFLALYYINKKKHLIVLFLLPVIYSIHSVAVLTLATYFLIYYIFKKQLNYKIMVVIYLIVVAFQYSIANVITTNLPEYISMLPIIDDRFSHYYSDSERWFGMNALKTENIQSSYAFVLTTIFAVSSICMGGLSLKYKYSRNVSYIFNISTIGFILYRIGALFELLNRITIPLEFLYFVPVGYAIYFFMNNKGIISRKDNIVFKISLVGFITYQILYNVRFIIMPEWYGFIWNN